MNPIQVIRWGLLGVVVCGSFVLGMKYTQAKWDKTENQRLEAVQEALTAERERVRLVNDTLAAVNLRLAQKEREASELNDRLQRAINQEPVTKTVRIEVPGECPDVDVALPDPGIHYRLFNCGITGNCSAAIATETNLDPLPGAFDAP